MLSGSLATVNYRHAGDGVAACDSVIYALDGGEEVPRKSIHVRVDHLG